MRPKDRASLVMGVGEHRNALRQKFADSIGRIRLVSPYVTEWELLKAAPAGKVRLLTRLSAVDLAFGATTAFALRRLLKFGVRMRYTSADLHAKAYIFDDSAIVTSANFTQKALSANVEVGVQLAGPSVRELRAWFDNLWGASKTLNLRALEECEVASRKYARRAKAIRRDHAEHEPGEFAGTSFEGSARRDARFFLCNTNRRYDPELGCENAMHARGFAASWTPFRKRGDYALVRPGDVVLAYAKKHGIIGVGVALGVQQVLAKDDEDCIAPREHRGEFDPDFQEWRCPARWIAWDVDRPLAHHKAGGKLWYSPQGSFLLIAPDDVRFAGVVQAALRHFKLPYRLRTVGNAAELERTR